MEHLAWYELLLLFFAASFLGWVLETAAADIKQKKFVNRGLVTGPFCVMYHDGTFNGRAGRIAWYLVVFIFCNLCDGGGMDRGSPDRTVISSAMVGLFREKRELGRLYLPGCFCVLGCSGICDGDLGK